MNEPPLVSVVVPTHNRVGSLIPLLRALDAQDYPNYEVVVVDDASNDSTGSVLRSWCGEGRRTVRLETSQGPYKARNEGWRSSRGGIVAFTDDDCAPKPDWLTQVVEPFRREAVVGVQGMTLTDRDQVTPFTHQIEQLEAGPPYRTCNLAYRREVLEKLGGFDDGLRWYADNIFGFKARQLGGIAFQPSAVVHHPPRQRDWRDRRHWIARFQADARHRRELQRLGVERKIVPRGLLPLALWVFRPLLRQSTAHAKYFVAHPLDYVRYLPSMLHEKRELAAALLTYWFKPDVQGGELPEPLRKPKVSVVVVTRSRPQLLRETLDALARQTWDPLQVIVVDNGPQLDAKAVADEANALYIPAPGMTLSVARQRGLEAASGDIIAFTDDDCLPEPDWAEMLALRLIEQPELVGVQGKTVSEPGIQGARTVQVRRPDRLYRTCNIAYRRDVLDASGGFDARFRRWFEDTALAARAQKYGTIGFESAALVWHRPIERPPLGREEWVELLGDERTLAKHYPNFYWRRRGPGFLFTVVARWLIGSPIKTMTRALPSLPAHPSDFLSLTLLLLTERIELLKALSFKQGRTEPSVPSSKGLT